MANVSLGTLRDLLKKTADWVDGLYEPKVKMLGTDGTNQKQIKTGADGKIQVDAALTGSNVDELYRTVGFSVTAGATTAVTTIIFNGKLYTSYTIGIDGISSHDFEIKESWLDSQGAFLNYQDVVKSAGATRFYLTAKSDVKSNELTIYIKNNDTVDHTYNVAITGIVG